MTRRLILPLQSQDAPLETVGGKGASLARLVRAGYPVPDSFMISTAAYREYVEANNLQEQILSRLVDLSANDPAAQ